jgi:branched-chain amino acid transport system permease protein
MIAFVVAGALSGIAGALLGMLYRIVPIDSVHWLGSVYVVFMVVIGGSRTMIGPAVGAFVFIWSQGLLSLVWAQWPLLLGMFVIAKRWSVGWNGDFIEGLPRRKRRNYGTVGSAGSH